MTDYVVETGYAVDPIPAGFHTITPYVVVNGAERLIDFMKAAFDAELQYILKDPHQKVVHASVRIGNSNLMIADSNEKMLAIPCMLYLYVHDVDKVYKRAIETGAESLREPIDEFYGDRSAGVMDRWNNHWWIATHIEDVDPAEIQRRAEQAFAKMPK